MAGEIIRLGDRTSHNGTVLEGSQTDICLGKPIAYIGHKVHCPKCKGDFPIIEGVPTTTIFGKGVALAGMKTSCGAVLIASQFTDTVEWGGGSSSSSAKNITPESAPGHVMATSSVSSSGVPTSEGKSFSQAATSGGKDEQPHDEQFFLKDKDGVILSGMPYTVILPSGQRIHGVTDGDGRTGRYSTQGAQYIEVCLGHID
ncbi:PAAR domain-containing protein [Pseudoduganella violaceinigra]|uniref:PAAR domain-containing protein n=1 Tax=Pseudoduganella violaceinigra TaxID=246602 RepID=UPI000A00D197|nr:PAAR domain-containing protein [Pseudoduganella violaceinigra]